ncbi:DUF2531 family protein [Brenneria sp. 4F2]|nr:DUF2531 family protein [Brenneria bubanii]
MNKPALDCLLLAFILPGAASTNAAIVSRDPFQPLFALRCAPSQMMQSWRLKGVIGSGNSWVGWLAQPESRWQRLTAGTVISPGDWQVIRVDKHGAMLAAVERDKGCEGAPAEVALLSPFVNQPGGQ